MSDNVIPFSNRGAPSGEPETEWGAAWREFIGTDFNLCRCGHFLFKHHDNTGRCYGVDIDDHSIRCVCGKADPVPDEDDTDD